MRLNRFSYGRIWLFAFTAAFVYWLPAWLPLHKTGFGDWQQFLHQWEAARIAIVRHGEWPLWNPYHCGGVMLWGDPQAQAYSPFFPLALLLGSNIALKLSMTVHMAVGLVGAFLFARDQVAMTPQAASLAAFFWCTTGFFAWHLSGGHPAFFPFFFTPWVLLFWREAQTDRRGVAKLALVLTVTLFEGGVYPFPFFALLLLFDGVFMMLSSDRIAALKAAVGVVTLTTLSSAFRLVPVANTMHNYPRPTSGGDKLGLDEVLTMFTAYSHARRWDHEYVWDEYGTLIGWSGLALVAVGVLALLVERRWWVLAGALTFGALMLGDRGEFWPWRLLHHVPVFDSLRVPSRFAVLLTFFLSLGAGIAADRLRRRLNSLFGRNPRFDFAPLLIATLVAVEMYAGNFSVISRFRYPALASDQTEPSYYLTPASEYHDYASFPARGVGNPRCYSGMNYPPARQLWTGEQAQARIDAGEVIAASRTNNTLFAEVRATRKATVTLNQTHTQGWQGRIVHLDKPDLPGLPPAFDSDLARPDKFGRTTVTVPKGHHRVELRYAPRYFWESLCLSLLGFALTAGTYLSRKAHRKSAC